MSRSYVFQSNPIAYGRLGVAFDSCGKDVHILVSYRILPISMGVLIPKQSDRGVKRRADDVVTDDAKRSKREHSFDCDIVMFDAPAVEVGKKIRSAIGVLR